jgi:hypothetical protein
MILESLEKIVFLTGLTTLVICSLSGIGSFFFKYDEKCLATRSAWIGLLIFMVAIEFLNFFSGVNKYITNSLLCLGMMVFIYKNRDFSVKKLNLFSSGKKPIIYLCFIVLAIFFIVFFKKIMNLNFITDSGLYHFSAIQWIENHKIQLGLGNLHGRLAFNQSYFVLIASFNGVFEFARGYEITALIIVLLYLLSCHEFLIKNLSLSNLFIVTLLSYFLLKDGSLSATSPDFVNCVLQIVIFYLFISGIRQKYFEATTFFPILAIAVLSYTNKFSSIIYAFGFIAVILWTNFRNKKLFVEILQSWGMTGLITLALLIHFSRGVMLSGYPFFPSTVMGFPTLEWAVPRIDVIDEARWIYSWARSPGLNPDQVLEGWGWLNGWIDSHLAIIRILAISSTATLISLAVGFRYGNKLQVNKLSIGFIPLYISEVFWFISAPDPRFLGMTPYIVTALACIIIFDSLPKIFNKKVLIYIIAISIIYILVMSIKLTKNLNEKNNIPISENIKKLTNSNLAIKIPTNGSLCWYETDPCTPYFNMNLSERKYKLFGLDYYGYINER